LIQTSEGREARVFFSEEKKQKTFFSRNRQLGAMAWMLPQASRNKSLLVLFFRKELLSCTWLSGW
jgi:hypothetical protein